MRKSADGDSKANSLVLLLDLLKADYPDISFQAADHFRWSPETLTIFYNPASKTAVWSLLHEVGHMVCGHKNYKTDFGLLRLEVSAWQKAIEVSDCYGFSISKIHIEDCLDSYREWMFRRSSCPACTQAGIETRTGQYSCINCPKIWHVSSARFCRVYRKAVATAATA